MGLKISKKVNIGVVLDLSGEASQDAVGIRDGINLAVKNLKNDGYNVQAEYFDDKSDVSATISVANEFIEKYRIKALIGPTWSYQVGSIAPIIEQEKLPTFAPAVSSDCVIAKSQFLLFGSEKNIYKTKPLSDFIQKHKIEKIALVVSQDGWGVSHIMPIQKAVQNSSTELVYVEQLLPYISSFGEQSIQYVVDNIISKKADLIIWAGYEFEANALSRLLLKNNLNIPIIGDQLLVFGERLNLLKKYKGDIFIFNTKFPNSFEKLFREHYHKSPTLYSDVAYDGMRILTENIAKGLVGEQLIKRLKNKRFVYKGQVGNYCFDQNGDVNFGGRWEIKKIY